MIGALMWMAFYWGLGRGLIGRAGVIRRDLALMGAGPLLVPNRAACWANKRAKAIFSEIVIPFQKIKILKKWKMFSSLDGPYRHIFCGVYYACPWLPECSNKQTTTKKKSKKTLGDSIEIHWESITCGFHPSNGISQGVLLLKASLEIVMNVPAYLWPSVHGKP